MFPTDVLLNAKTRAALYALLDTHDDNFKAALPNLESNPEIARACMREGYRLLLLCRRVEIQSRRRRNAPAFDHPRPVGVKPADEPRAREALRRYGIKLPE